MNDLKKRLKLTLELIKTKLKQVNLFWKPAGSEKKVKRKKGTD